MRAITDLNPAMFGRSFKAERRGGVIRSGEGRRTLFITITAVATKNRWNWPLFTEAFAAEGR